MVITKNEKPVAEATVVEMHIRIYTNKHRLKKCVVNSGHRELFGRVLLAAWLNRGGIEALSLVNVNASPQYINLMIPPTSKTPLLGPLANMSPVLAIQHVDCKVSNQRGCISG